ncbi:MAG: hypothetical protein IJZ82_02720 [Lachnospiraceae bacterium]|nr:hypothetical protein [Lachnospiraceae bacterium]
MSLYEGKEKKSNAGFVKVIEKKDAWEAQVRLQGVPVLFDGKGLLEVAEGQQSLGSELILLNGGGASGQYEWEKKGSLDGLTLLLRLSEDCVLFSGDWGTVEGKTATVEVREEVVTAQEDSWLAQEILWTEPEAVLIQEELIAEEVAEGEDEVTAQKEGVDKVSEDKVENRKWKQICKVYPHVKPFGDFREYIKLELKDMVLLSEKRYSLVENSFLLHGYYNYGHIILWRKEKAPVKYYVGVPGNFYDKEKQVAVLYGFESFEGAVEPAKEGDFGYYMTEVGI